jgi:cyclase
MCTTWRSRTFFTLLASTFLHSPVFAQEEQGLTIERLSETIYVLFGRGGNIGVSAGADGVFIIDDQFDGDAEMITQAVATLSDMPIDYVLNTHWHWDHAGSNEFFGHAGSTIIAHDKVRSRLESGIYFSQRDMDIPPAPKEALPVITFSDSLSLHLNGDNVHMLHVAAGHTEGDGVVWFKDSNIVHMGDNFLVGIYPLIDVDDGGSLDGMITTVETVLAFVNDETKIIPGHGPVSDKAGLLAYRDLCIALRDRITEMKGRGLSVEEMIAAGVTDGFDEAWNDWGEDWKSMSIRSLSAAIP